jgi:hypothetical protein
MAQSIGFIAAPIAGLEDGPPDPLPRQLPGALPSDVRVLDLDVARTFPVRGLVEGDEAFDGRVVAIRGVHGSIVGFAQVRKAAGGLVFEGSIDYETPERLLLETEQGRLSAELREAGIAIVWPSAEVEAQS